LSNFQELALDTNCRKICRLKFKRGWIEPLIHFENNLERLEIFIDQCSTIKVYTNHSIKIAKQQAKNQFLHAQRKIVN